MRRGGESIGAGQLAFFIGVADERTTTPGRSAVGVDPYREAGYDAIVRWPDVHAEFRNRSQTTSRRHPQAVAEPAQVFPFAHRNGHPTARLVNLAATVD